MSTALQLFLGFLMRKFIFLTLCLFAFPVMAETAAYFSPSLACENNIIKLLNNAKKRIDIVVYSINNWNIYTALQETQKRGIPIRILTDRTQAGGRGAKAPALHAEGFNIRVHSKNKIEHNKFMVVDGETLITGSYNWTNPASLKNSENCLLIWNDPKTISAYQKRFEYLWEINTAEKSEQWFQMKALKEKQEKGLSFEKSSAIKEE